jgi:NitT/TauT family transport system permease protein
VTEAADSRQAATVEAETSAVGPIARKSNRFRLVQERILVVAFGIATIGGWELICRGYGISDLVLPPPSQVLVSLYNGFATGQFISALRITLTEIVVGFLLAAAAALFLGTMISQVRLVEVVLLPYIVALQTLPKIALAPLILVWVGFGIESKIIVAALVAFFPILVNTVVGLKNTPTDKIELMQSLSASRWKIFRYVQFPEALPFIFAGLNIGIVMAVLGAIVGEFIGSSNGLGYLLLQMNYQMDISGMFAVLFVLAVLGILLNAIAQFARRRIIFWQRENSLTS